MRYDVRAFFFFCLFVLMQIHRIFTIDMINTVSIHEPKVQRAAKIARALAHPARISILRILAGRSTCFCGDLTDLLPLAQSTISQHLKVLSTAGLISATAEGVRNCYCLRPEGVRELKGILNELTDELVATC